MEGVLYGPDYLKATEASSCVHSLSSRSRSKSEPTAPPTPPTASPPCRPRPPKDQKPEVRRFAAETVLSQTEARA